MARRTWPRRTARDAWARRVGTGDHRAVGRDWQRRDEAASRNSSEPNWDDRRRSRRSTGVSRARRARAMPEQCGHPPKSSTTRPNRARVARRDRVLSRVRSSTRSRRSPPSEHGDVAVRACAWRTRCSPTRADAAALHAGPFPLVFEARRFVRARSEGRSSVTASRCTTSRGSVGRRSAAERAGTRSCFPGRAAARRPMISLGLLPDAIATRTGRSRSCAFVEDDSVAAILVVSRRA